MKSQIKKKEFTLDAVDTELLKLRYGGHYKNREPKIPEIRYGENLIATLPSMLKLVYYVRDKNGKHLCEGSRETIAKFIFEEMS